MTHSIILVGMPGSGKSTLGRLLANRTQLPFADTDQYIEGKAGCSLQHYLDQHGYLQLRDLEERVILEHSFPDTVVSTGGSVVYSDKAMTHLKRFGRVLYLAVSEAELMARIHNFDSRGIACRPGQSFASLFAERSRLYQQYADITLYIDGEDEQASLARCLTLLGIE